MTSNFKNDNTIINRTPMLSKPHQAIPYTIKKTFTRFLTPSLVQNVKKSSIFFIVFTSKSI